MTDKQSGSRDEVAQVREELDALLDKIVEARTWLESNAPGLAYEALGRALEAQRRASDAFKRL